MNMRSEDNAIAKDGIPTINPYFKKSKYENLISCFFKIESHIIPAKAPKGEINAPKFEPIIEEYIAPNLFEAGTN